MDKKMAYTKNMNYLKQFNNKEIFSNHQSVKQEENVFINPYTSIMYNGDNLMSVGVSMSSHHPVYSLVPDGIQPVSVPPTEQTSQQPQDYIIQELLPQLTIKSSKEKHPNNVRPFECEICFRRFNQKQTLKQHILTHTGQRPFECNVCFKTFTQQGALQRHTAIHTGEKPFQCTFCKLYFRQKINLQRHMKLHTGAPKEFQCRICSREFSRKGALLRHIPTHDNDRPKTKCTCCNKDFLNKESLLRHEKNQELREKGIYIPKRKLLRNGKLEKVLIKCTNCNKLYRRTKSLISLPNEMLNENCFKCYQETNSTHEKNGSKLGIVRETEIFSCTQCEAIFQKISSYEKHKLLHSENRKYECDICHLRFKEKRFIRGHILTHIDVCEFQCHMCGLKFKYLSKLKAHYVLHVDDVDDLSEFLNVFKCSQCSRIFYQRNQIIRHLKTHGKDKIKSNQNEFGEEKRIDKEMDKNEIVTKMNDECIETGVQEDVAISNVTDNILEPYVNLSFDENNDFYEDGVGFGGEMNENELSEDKSVTHPFFCYICKKSYTRKRSLNRHFQVAHTNYDKFPCDVCDKKFQTKNSLKQHCVLHLPHNFKCTQCERTFNRKDALASHELIHSNIKTFLCPHCPKSFYQKQSLHTHIVQHKGAKNYECGVCGKCFFEKSTLNRHYLSHSGERKYSCFICNMSFIQKNHLDKHFIRHDEIEKKMKFECLICGKVFYRKDHYLRHKGSHETNRILFPCEKCNRKFTDKYSLARHVKFNKCIPKPKGRKKKKPEGDNIEIKTEDEIKKEL